MGRDLAGCKWAICEHVVNRLSGEWMTSVPAMSRHVFPPANDDFTRGKSPLVRAVNGLSDPKLDLIA